MRPKEEALAAILAARQRLGRTTIVGISGIDAAGKTTLAAELEGELRADGQAALVVEGDDFNRPSNERSLYPADEADYGFAYDVLARELLVPVRENIRVEARLSIKDWPADAWTERDFAVEPGTIVLVEGVFLFTPALLPVFDLTIWLEISFERAFERALVRDADAMGGPDGVRERYETRYFPGQRRHLHRDRPRERADLVFGASSGRLPDSS